MDGASQPPPTLKRSRAKSTASNQRRHREPGMAGVPVARGWRQARAAHLLMIKISAAHVRTGLGYRRATGREGAPKREPTSEASARERQEAPQSRARAEGSACAGVDARARLDQVPGSILHAAASACALQLCQFVDGSERQSSAKYSAG